MLRGPRLLLRPPRDSDQADRLRWGRDPEFRRAVGGDPRETPPLTEEEVRRWYEEVSQDCFCWIIDLEGTCIGTARLHSLDEANGCARFAIGIFSPRFWGQGYGAEATRLVLCYAFVELKLHRVDLRVLAFNERAIRCYERCGFLQEGVEREGSLIGGVWQTDVLMSILEHEYRALERSPRSRRTQL